MTEHQRLTLSAKAPPAPGCLHCGNRILQTGRAGHPRTTFCSNECQTLALRLNGRPTGRWAPLVWFTKSERIMEPDELAAALERLQVAA